MRIELRWMVALAAIGAAACSQQGQVQSASMAPAATAPAVAAETAPAVTVPAAGTATASAGMKVYIDPATGQPRDPTPEEVAAANRTPRVSAQSSTAGDETTPVHVLPSGQMEVHVGARAMHEVRVCRQPDGSIGEQNCPPVTEQKP